MASQGILKLELDKESYERAGLVGQAIRSGGRKHMKARYRTMPTTSAMACPNTDTVCQLSKST